MSGLSRNGTIHLLLQRISVSRRETGCFWQLTVFQPQPLQCVRQTWDRLFAHYPGILITSKMTLLVLITGSDLINIIIRPSFIAGPLCGMLGCTCPEADSSLHCSMFNSPPLFNGCLSVVTTRHCSVQGCLVRLLEISSAQEQTEHTGCHLFR